MRRQSVMRVAVLAVVGGVVVSVVGVVRPLRRQAREIGRRTVRRARYMRGVEHGWEYRLQGRHPDPAVPDTVLADRVRSELGRVEKRLDLPRVNVMVEEHVAHLHGDVPSRADEEKIEQAVREVAGVEGVESHLHIGLIEGDTRPSEGQVGGGPSYALERLLGAVRHAGGRPEEEVPTLEAVLTALMDELPSGEGRHLLAHLPSDVRSKVVPRSQQVSGRKRARSVDDLVKVVIATGRVEPERAAHVVESVFGVVRELVPEEAADVAAVLPSEIRDFWKSAVPS